MLKLNVYCSLVPNPRDAKIQINDGSRLNGYDRTSRLQRITVKAVKDGMDGGMSRLPGRSWDPGLEIEVPFEQRPVGVATCQYLLLSVQLSELLNLIITFLYCAKVHLKI